MAKHEFKRSIDLYTNVYNEDKQEMEEKLIKKNAKVKWFCQNLDEITDYEEILNDKGKIIKNKTCLFHRTRGELIVDGSYEEIKKILEEKKQKEIYGFRNKN